MTDPTDEVPDDVPVQARIRHAPKLGVFMLVGAIIGLFVTLVVTALFPSDPRVGFIALFGYFSLYGVPIGLVLGAVVGLVFDRRSSRRSQLVTVEREHAELEPAPDMAEIQDDGPAVSGDQGDTPTESTPHPESGTDDSH